MAADLALLRAKQMGRDRVCAYQAVNVVAGERDCRELHHLIDQERAAHVASHSPGQSASGSADGAFTCADCRSVTRYAMTLAHALGMPEREAEEVRRAALWLDISRLRQSHLQRADNDRPGAGSASGSAAPGSWEERSPITQGLLGRTFRASSVPANVLHMREWFNGQGYPDRLTGDEIPVPARILAVADAYERLLIGNGDTDPLPPAEALSVLEGRAGTQLDPELVSVFRTALEASDGRATEIACAAASCQNARSQRSPEPSAAPAVGEEASDHAASV
jgi:hypothetical protein